jgi:hypothetical protein
LQRFGKTVPILLSRARLVTSGSICKLFITLEAINACWPRTNRSAWAAQAVRRKRTGAAGRHKTDGERAGVGREGTSAQEKQVHKRERKKERRARVSEGASDEYYKTNSGETSQRLVTRRLDSFVDFCGRARTLESLTNDSNLFDESFKGSFDESFALWAFYINQNT